MEAASEFGTGRLKSGAIACSPIMDRTAVAMAASEALSMEWTSSACGASAHQIPMLLFYARWRSRPLDVLRDLPAENRRGSTISHP